MGKSPIRNYLLALISPFGLVLVLTLVTFVLVLIFPDEGAFEGKSKLLSALGYWQNGFFGLLGFTLQMMIILVFGYTLAIFKPVNSLLRKVSQVPNSLISAVLATASLTMVSGFLNWGFGLIVGAVLARFMHEALLSKKIASNPALLAASGYLGMGIWHGGFSGSAPLSVAEDGHFLMDKIGIVPVEATIFSGFNILTTCGLFFVLIVTAWLLAKTSSSSSDTTEAVSLMPLGQGNENNLGRIVGLAMLLVVLIGLIFEEEKGLGFVSLNWVNFLLFSLTLIAYRSTASFSNAVATGLKSTADIFIQFPFYAGILGLITDSGLLTTFAAWGSDLANPEFFPLLTFLSAGIINLLVPSGGGQWAIQGPIIFETAEAFGLDKGKMIMVFAYGDQISNLLQPFWALPLLAITGVSVRKIVPYTLIFFIMGLIWLGLSVFWFL